MQVQLIYVHPAPQKNAPLCPCSHLYKSRSIETRNKAALPFSVILFEKIFAAGYSKSPLFTPVYSQSDPMMSQQHHMYCQFVEYTELQNASTGRF